METICRFPKRNTRNFSNDQRVFHFHNYGSLAGILPRANPWDSSQSPAVMWHRSAPVLLHYLFPSDAFSALRNICLLSWISVCPQTRGPWQWALFKIPARALEKMLTSPFFRMKVVFKCLPFRYFTVYHLSTFWILYWSHNTDFPQYLYWDLALLSTT